MLLNTIIKVYKYQGCSPNTKYFVIKKINFFFIGNQIEAKTNDIEWIGEEDSHLVLYKLDWGERNMIFVWIFC